MFIFKFCEIFCEQSNIFIFQDEIAGTMGLAWIIVQHFLFGLIGAAVNISDIQANTAGKYQNFSSSNITNSVNKLAEMILIVWSA